MNIMEPNTVKIRQECSDDVEAIRAVNVAAFGRSQESVIVDALRTNGAVALSLVGVLGKRNRGPCSVQSGFH